MAIEKDNESIGLKTVTGTKDILPEELFKFRWIEEQSRKVWNLYGYREIATPIFEATELFIRSIGVSTDIVEKEMYTFKDKGERMLTLRPEATASIVRAYLQNSLYQQSQLAKLYYIGPMFRSEKPQRGRYRQFHQIGIEAIGSAEPSLDAEVIMALMHFLDKIGLSDLNLHINSIGCPKCRADYREKLTEYVNKHISEFCNDCKNRVLKNPLRVMDCKSEKCKSVIVKAPVIKDYLCSLCSSHFKKVLKYLELLSIRYKIDNYLVRGLDYYTRTTFEVIDNKLGAQNALGGGGRYDGLIEELGGNPTPGIGFAMGIERILESLELHNVKIPSLDSTRVFFAVLDEKSLEKAMILAKSLREERISAEVNMDATRSLKSQLRSANQLNVSFTVIIGENELKKEKVILKNMKESIQDEIPLEKLKIEIKKKLNI